MIITCLAESFPRPRQLQNVQNVRVPAGMEPDRLPLQLTYETEVAYHNVKRREAELQLVQARENCEKVRRKRAAFMGSLRIAHSTTLDDVDRSITEAKSALEAVKQDLQVRTVCSTPKFLFFFSFF